MPNSSIEERIKRLHAHGIVDLHFDLPMELYEKRTVPGTLADKFLAELEAGDVGVLAAAIYIEDRYLPDNGLRVALGQIARLYIEAGQSQRFSICRSSPEICQARKDGKIALLITMEGIEPIGSDLDLLCVFHQLGVRAISLTHARRNAAGAGGVFAPEGSPSDGLTNFGRDVIRECERLGIIIDLAHISPAGFTDAIAIATKPVIVSHTNARRFYNIERNIADDQIKAIGEQGGVIGINAVLVSPRKEESTLDRYVDHIEHVMNLSSIDHVGIGFDFFEFIYRQWPDAMKQEIARKLAEPHFIPDLANHSHARNLTRKLIERGFSDQDIEKILFRNWMRIFKELL